MIAALRRVANVHQPIFTGCCFRLLIRLLPIPVPDVRTLEKAQQDGVGEKRSNES